MKKKILAFILTFGVLVSLLVGCTPSDGDIGTTNPSTGTTAPTLATNPTTEPAAPATLPPFTVPVNTARDFVVYDMDGNEVRLSDFFGKPIVLNFWASWCGPCRGEMPHFNEKYLELGDKVQFMMINLTASDYSSDALALLQEQGYQFPVFFDKAEEAGNRYYVSAIPVTVFIDAEGVIQAKYVGMMDKQTLEDHIKMIYTETEEQG